MLLGLRRESRTQACSSFSRWTGSLDCAAIMGSLNEAGGRPRQGLRSEPWFIGVATSPCSMLIFRKQTSNLPQISAFLRHLRGPWLYPFKKSRTFLLEVLSGNARMPSTGTRSISVRSGGESVQLLGGRQRSVSMETGGAGLTAQVGRVLFDRVDRLIVLIV